MFPICVCSCMSLTPVFSFLQDSAEYDEAIFPCHQRSADRIVNGALKNGGLYIKLGQGLSTFNQVLPRQYTDTLKSLQDKVEIDLMKCIIDMLCTCCRPWLGNLER